MDFKEKVIIVTGCNTGLGKQTAKQLAAYGATVIMACRSKERTEPALQDIVSETQNSRVTFMQLDLASLDSVRKFAAEFNEKYDRLNILVNNAGIFTSERQVTQDGHEMMFGVNHLGHFLLTNLLLDKLKSSVPSRIVVLSSKGHERCPIKMDDLDSEKSYKSINAYGKSKSANVLFAVHLAKILEGSGVTLYSLHPGIIKTDLSRDYKWLDCCCCSLLLHCFACCICDPVKSIEGGAETTLYCCTEPGIAEHTGRYYSDAKESRARNHATNPTVAAELWERSLEMCGLSSSA